MLQSFLETLSSTAFLTTLAGTFMAAWAGAYAAQAVTMRREDRRELVSEVRAVNAASTLAVTITNKFLTVKQQHVRGMVIKFNAEQQAYDDFQASSKTSPGPHVLEFNFDFKFLQAAVVPIETLASLCFEKMELPTRGVVSMSDLQNSVGSFEAALAERTNLITEHQRRVPPRSDKDTIEWYLGVNTDAGSDQRFKDNLTAIEHYCDDCIYFGRTLCDELADHGRRLRSAHWWRFARPVHVRGKPDWSRAAKAGIMPDSAEYALWEAGFAKRRSWYRRLLKRR